MLEMCFVENCTQIDEAMMKYECSKGGEIDNFIISRWKMYYFFFYFTEYYITTLLTEYVS